MERHLVRIVADGWYESEWPSLADARFLGTQPVDEHWEARARNNPHLEIVGEVGAAEAVDLIVRADASRMIGWAIRVRFVPNVRGLLMTQREERLMPPDIEEGVVIDADGDVHAYRHEAAAEPALLTNRLIRAVGLGNVSEQSKELLTNTVVLTTLLGPGWNRPLVRPRRKQTDTHIYALWANRYVWALDQTGARRSPNTHIAEVDTAAGHYRTTKQVENMVRRARELGLLSTPGAGRVGGNLTPKGLGLLADLHVEPGSDHLVVTGTYDPPEKRRAQI